MTEKESVAGCGPQSPSAAATDGPMSNKRARTTHALSSNPNDVPPLLTEGLIIPSGLSATSPLNSSPFSELAEYGHCKIEGEEISVSEYEGKSSSASSSSSSSSSSGSSNGVNLSEINIKNQCVLDSWERVEPGHTITRPPTIRQLLASDNPNSTLAPYSDLFSSTHASPTAIHIHISL